LVWGIIKERMRFAAWQFVLSTLSVDSLSGGITLELEIANSCMDLNSNSEYRPTNRDLSGHGDFQHDP
jgi:hypothetical protein